MIRDGMGRYGMGWDRRFGDWVVSQTEVKTEGESGLLTGLLLGVLKRSAWKDARCTYI